MSSSDLLPTLIRLRDAMREESDRSRDNPRRTMRLPESYTRMSSFVMGHLDEIIDALTPQPPADSDSWPPQPLKPDGTVEARVEPGELPPPEWESPADLAETAAELERLLAEATPGPWGAEALRWLLRYGRKNEGTWDEELRDDEWLPDGGDAPLIVAMRAVLPSLLAALKRRSEDAEVGELLRRVEERHLGNWRLEGFDSRGGNYIRTYDPETQEKTGEAWGETPAAAIRQLLGGSK